MERSIIHSIIHLKPPISFHVKLPFLWQAVEENECISTSGSSLSFLLPKKCLLFRESLSQTGGQS